MRALRVFAQGVGLSEGSLRVMIGWPRISDWRHRTPGYRVLVGLGASEWTMERKGLGEPVGVNH